MIICFLFVCCQEYKISLAIHFTYFLNVNYQLTENYLWHAEASDELKNTKLDVEDRRPVLVQMFAGAKCRLMTNATVRVQLQASSVLYRDDGVLHNGGIAVWVAASSASVKNYSFHPAVHPSKLLSFPTPGPPPPPQPNPRVFTQTQCCWSDTAVLRSCGYGRIHIQ
jgi:hypothetical protein